MNEFKIYLLELSRKHKQRSPGWLAVSRVLECIWAKGEISEAATCDVSE